MFHIIRSLINYKYSLIKLSWIILEIQQKPAAVDRPTSVCQKTGRKPARSRSFFQNILFFNFFTKTTNFDRSFFLAQKCRKLFLHPVKFIFKETDQSWSVFYLKLIFKKPIEISRLFRSVTKRFRSIILFFNKIDRHRSVFRSKMQLKSINKIKDSF